jgi:hypothetical protein
VVEQRVVVAVLVAAHEHQAIERRVGAFAGEDDVQIVSRQLPAQRRAVRDELARAAIDEFTRTMLASIPANRRSVFIA